MRFTRKFPLFVLFFAAVGGVAGFWIWLTRSSLPNPTEQINSKSSVITAEAPSSPTIEGARPFVPNAEPPMHGQASEGILENPDLISRPDRDEESAVAPNGDPDWDEVRAARASMAEKMMESSELLRPMEHELRAPESNEVFQEEQPLPQVDEP